MFTSDIEKRINACWLGKAVGGTLGTPHEGKPGPLDLDFYRPVPTYLLPNDDLDLQIVWAHHLLNSKALKVTPDVMSEAWRQHVRFPYDEYGIALRNFDYGLSGEAVGAFDNWFAEGMGAAIRSELWACLAPGNPGRAAGFAWADAVCDHAGDGVWAVVFLSALQSAAFVERDQKKLIEGALAFLPPTSRVKSAVIDTLRWWQESRDWLQVRQQIMSNYGSINFTDVAANLAFTILGWIAGESDFGKSICIATNCGEDTDCTAATLGALLGILDPQGIPDRWRQPIGTKIVLSPEIKNLPVPESLDHLTEWTLRLSRQLADVESRIGAVITRAPASRTNSPISISVRSANSGDLLLMERDDAPLGLGFTEGEIFGHWLRDTEIPAEAPVRVLDLTFELGTDIHPVLMAHSYSNPTSVWVDGVRIKSRDPFTKGKSFSAPSLHRAQYGEFDPGLLTAGSHRMTIAWDRSGSIEGVADLVIGVGKRADRLWFPHALAKQR